MGELIAKAVYAGVMEAVYRQNGTRTERNIFRRLQERKIDLYKLAAGCSQVDPSLAGKLANRLENLLLKPRIRAFLEIAFALSDARERGLVSDLGPFEFMCGSMAEEIAGKPVVETVRCDGLNGLPRVLDLAFTALISGTAAQITQGEPYEARR